MMVALLAIPVSVLAGLTMDFGATFAKRQALAAGADSAALSIINQKRQLVVNNPEIYRTCLTLLTTDPLSTAAKATAVTQVNNNSQYGQAVPASDITAVLSCQGNNLVADVTVDTTVPTTLGGLVGVSTLRANSVAQATIKVGDKAPCGLCVLGHGNHSLQNGTIGITNGGIAFNGNAGSGPNGDLNVDGPTSIAGSWLYPSKGSWVPAPLQNQGPQDDPLGYMSLPPDTTGLAKKSNICTGGPGIYASLTPTMKPCLISGGLYVITGGSQYSGSNDVLGSAATLYFTCQDASGMPRECGVGEGAGASFTGQATLGITAPSTAVNNGIPGVAILADRNYAGVLSFRGNPTSGITGTIYAPGATLDLRGNGATTFTSLIVVKDITFSGTGATLNINYDEALNRPLDPAPQRLTR